MSLREVRANPSTTQDNVVFIEARQHQHVVLDHIYVSALSPVTVSLVNSVSHDVVWLQYVGPKGGSTGIYGASSIHGEGLDLNTDADSAVFIWVKYHYSND